MAIVLCVIIGKIDIVGKLDVTLPKIPIILDDVKCRGTESSLTQCPNAGFAIHNCVHYEDIVLDCRGIVHNVRIILLQKNVKSMYFLPWILNQFDNTKQKYINA